MEDLFLNTHLIKLTDQDFRFGRSNVKLINKSFKRKDGYLMIYAPWCPNCRNKSDFWTYLGEKFNYDPKYVKENFKIGVINTTDPHAERILQTLKVNAIPHFMHVTPDKEGNGDLSDYQGQDFAPQTLMAEVCQQKNRLCRLKI